MANAIIVCGMNGAGKSTLGRALAQKLGYHFIDIEDIYFPKTDPSYLYSTPRTEEEVEEKLMEEISGCEAFVLAAVRGDYGERLRESFDLAVYVDVPKEIRLERVKKRSYDKFGERAMPGGGLYERERRFFEMCANRDDHIAENWVKTLDCPVIRVDGLRTVEENVDIIIEAIKNSVGK